MLNELSSSLNLIMTQTQANLKTLAVILAIPWLVFAVNILLGKRLLWLGIMPRRLRGLPGIVLSPFLHADFNHLFFNSIPLLVLSNFILINGLTYFILVSLIITLISGLLIWCFAQPGIHIGASALITGYWALLVSDLLQHGTLTAFILGILCVYYFAGIFFGIFPGKKGVSWEGHLFGLIAGLATGYFLPAILTLLVG